MTEQGTALPQMGWPGPGACILAAREAGNMIIDAFSDYGGKLLLPTR